MIRRHLSNGLTIKNKPTHNRNTKTMITEKVLEQCVELVRKTLTEAREAHIQMLAAQEQVVVLKQKRSEFSMIFDSAIAEITEKYTKHLVERDELIAQLQEEIEKLKATGPAGDAGQAIHRFAESGSSAEIPESQSTEFKIGDRIDHRDEGTRKWGTNYIFKGPDPRFEGFCMIQLSPFREKSVRLDSIRHSQSTEKEDLEPEGCIHTGDKVDVRFHDFSGVHSARWETGYTVGSISIRGDDEPIYGVYKQGEEHLAIEHRNLRLTPKEEPISVTPERTPPKFNSGNKVDVLHYDKAGAKVWTSGYEVGDIGDYPTYLVRSTLRPSGFYVEEEHLRLTEPPTTGAFDPAGLVT
jgi:hypothetical protein